MRIDQLKFLARLLLWGGLALLLALRYFDVNPITLEDEDPVEFKVEQPRRASGEVLVVVDGAAIEKAAEEESFKASDWSWAWVNTIEQEYGPLTVIERGALRSTALDPYKIVILTHSMARHGGDPDLATLLKTYVHTGGVLVLERPEGQLREAFAADGKGGRRQPKVISNIKDLGAPFDSHLKSMPLNTTYVGSSGPLEGATTWLAMDGVPVVYSKISGRGTAIVVEFDYGLQLTSLQQGRPRDDFSVANRYPEVLADVLESNDLVTDKRLLDNEVPYADLLEKYLVTRVFGEARPVVGLWPFKDGMQGALLMTHDEEKMGDKSAWMARFAQERGARSTYFIIPTEAFTQAGAKAVLEAGSEIQLHWDRPEAEQGIFDPVGVWKINPMARARSLKRQVEDLKAIAPGGASVIANRNHYLMWSEDYTEIFRQLAAAGIVIDSSYGPDKTCRGYLFGTGLPFWPIDKTGSPLPVMEMPLLAAETLGGVDAAFMLRLFSDSQDAWHMAINVLYHPNAYSWMPSAELFDLWLATYDLAEDTRHWPTTIGGLYRFWTQRRAASLSTTVSQERPEEPAPPPGEKAEDELLAVPPERGDPGQVTITIDVTVGEEGHSVTAPAQFRGRGFREVRRGSGLDNAISDKVGTTVTDVIGARFHLVPLRKGHNLLTVHYH